MKALRCSRLRLVFLASVLAVPGIAEPATGPVTPVVPSARQLFPPGAARLFEGPFKTMQDADHAYLMRLEPDRLLALFRVEAGLEPKAKPYGGWESPAQPGKTWSLAGHRLGHYLTAASLMYRPGETAGGVFEVRVLPPAPLDSRPESPTRVSIRRLEGNQWSHILSLSPKVDCSATSDRVGFAHDGRCHN